MDLSDLLEDALSRISQQIMDQQETLDEIVALLKHPYQTRVRELRIEGQKWLFHGMQRRERDRHEDWKDAMRLLKTVTDNPVGMQDYVVWFQTGWLLWKHQRDVIAAEEAFYRAQRLSTDSRDLYHHLSLRHLAHMQYLQGDNGHPGKLLEAYRTIHQALEVSSDYNTMYDAARLSARSKHEDEAVEFLEKCIDIHPHTVISMFVI